MHRTASHFAITASAEPGSAAGTRLCDQHTWLCPAHSGHCCIVCIFLQELSGRRSRGVVCLPAACLPPTAPPACVWHHLSRRTLASLCPIASPHTWLPCMAAGLVGWCACLQSSEAADNRMLQAVGRGLCLWRRTRVCTMPDRCEGGRKGLKQSFCRWPAQSRGCLQRTCTALSELARWLAGSSALLGPCLKWVLRTITDGNLGAAGQQAVCRKPGPGPGTVLTLE